MPAEIFPNINPNDPRTEGESYMLDAFANSSRFNGWTVFEEPHINSMKPDIILLHPKRGIIIIEIKDYNLALPNYLDNGYIVGQNGQQLQRNPVKQVEEYKDMILKLELSNSVDLSENHTNYYGCIETVVYFHNATRERALAFCGNTSQHVKIWTREDVEHIVNPQSKLDAYRHTYALAWDSSNFNKDGSLERLAEELSKKLQYADYNYERIQPYTLKPEQNRLAILSSGSIRRWSGVAGSGKSLILAEKCSRALKSNARVLILTFNITLRNYLRDLCSQQYGSEEREKLRKDLTILHFHGLLKTLITEHEIAVMNGDNDDECGDSEFTTRWINSINQHLLENPKNHQFNYDYILIDEGQDFKGEWIRFLKKFFTGVGEILIVYDKSQDIFDHGIWIEDSEQIKNIGFKGQPGNLKYTHRLPNTMVQRIHLVRQRLNINADDILVPAESQTSMTEKIDWINYRAETINQKLSQLVSQINILLKSNTLEDITILTTNENTGAEIVRCMESQGIKTSHVYDLQQQADHRRRRSQKWKFQGATGRLKICSYHSYKGWQTPNIILVLDSPCTKYLDGSGGVISGPMNAKSLSDALFISMSRIKGKASSGEFAFNCLNYLPDYDHLVDILGEDEIPF